jgi:hypothetical protein
LKTTGVPALLRWGREFFLEYLVAAFLAEASATQVITIRVRV